MELRDFRSDSSVIFNVKSFSTQFLRHCEKWNREVLHLTGSTQTGGPTTVYGGAAAFEP